jgi:drug/metabolite transporter (DMT)-like permease
MTPPSLRWASGLAFAAVAVLIFSGWFVVTRFTVTHQLRIWDVTALRFGTGTILLAPTLIRQRLPATAWLEGLFYALLWGAPFVLLVATGLRLTTAAQAASIVPALMPVLAGLISWRLTRQRPSASAIWSYLAILVGLAVLVMSRGSAQQSLDPWGYGALVLAATTWAVYSVCFRTSRLSALQSAALICFWSTVIFMPLYLGLDLSRLGQASTNEIGFQLLYQGVLMSGVALFAYNRAIAVLGAGAAAGMMALVPVLSTLLAVPVLGESPSFPGIAAIAVIALGVAMATRRPNSRPSLSEQTGDPA